MINLIDFSNCPDGYREYSRSDQKISIQYGQGKYMLKFPQHITEKKSDLQTCYANNVLSEYIGSHIVASVGLPAHETFLGFYKGQNIPIFPDGEPSYFATLPIKAMVKYIRDAGIPSNVSNTAGTFVCNHLMYGVLYTLAKKYPGIRGGFMHVPFIPQQVLNRPVPAPCLNLMDIVKGIEATVLAIAENSSDLKVTEGKTH